MRLLLLEDNARLAVLALQHMWVEGRMRWARRLIGNRAAAQVGDAIDGCLARYVLVADSNAIARIPDELNAAGGLGCLKD